MNKRDFSGEESLYNKVKMATEKGFGGLQENVTLTALTL